MNNEFNNQPMNNNISNQPGNTKSSNPIIAILLIIVFVGVLGVFGYKQFFAGKTDNKSSSKSNTVEKKEVKSEYKMTGNGLEKFDLSFLKLNNEIGNKVYSPLSIKYALEMLSEGTNGNTKAQLDAVIGDYTSRKYENSQNMSFANALFIKDTYKDSINAEYISKLSNKYNAEIVYDSFATSANVNKWVSDKTLNLINNVYDNISNKELMLLNALAIDMEWVNSIQPSMNKGDLSTSFSSSGGESKDRFGFRVKFEHEVEAGKKSDMSQPIGTSVSPIESGYHNIIFNTADSEEKQTEIYESGNYKALRIASVGNRYNVVATVGEENVRNTVSEAYKVQQEKYFNETPSEAKTKEAVDKYIKELNNNYNFVGSSTDFKFYVDENVKVFAKDLKEYNGVTLEYVGIMPMKETLRSYINNVDADKINTLISNLKDSKSLDSYEDGYVSFVTGSIPVFKFDYELKLKEDLKKLGITDVFSEEADLSKLTSDKSLSIIDASHKATIDFSNDGIKASAVTQYGGAGDAEIDMYVYEVPVKRIDLTFNNPYMYLIRNKNTGEVWFAGTVYEPSK